MKVISPLKFQKAAIDKLVSVFLRLWSARGTKLPLYLDAPTGSGKTFITSSFIHKLDSLPLWNVDKAFIWITFSDELAQQSKEKFNTYFVNNSGYKTLNVNDFDKGKLEKNDVLFINWQKVVSKAAENRVLRRPEDPGLVKEKGYYFEDLIENTVNEKRSIILIIDESHTHLTDLAQRTVIDFIDPKVIVKVSATHQEGPSVSHIEDGLAGYVRVRRSDVIAEGLIKENIIVQSDEDIKKFIGKDLDEVLIELGIKKRKELVKEYKRLNKRINPLVLIQLPNDDHELKKIGQRTKEEIVLQYLMTKGVDVAKHVALWFDQKKVNMEHVTMNSSDIDFMLFKQAAGTGWDCPRAHVLIMYRDINSPVFRSQTIGRIMRMPEPAKHQEYKESRLLSNAYLFTNHSRNQISLPDDFVNDKSSGTTSRGGGVADLQNIASDVVRPAERDEFVNSPDFQQAFIRALNKFFAIKEHELSAIARGKVKAKGVELDLALTEDILEDSAWQNLNGLASTLAGGEQTQLELSANDVAQLFNLCCFHLLKEQTKGAAAPGAWGTLKSALRIWFKTSLGLGTDSSYRIFINDINRGKSSVFREAVSQALQKFL